MELYPTRVDSKSSQMTSVTYHLSLAGFISFYGKLAFPSMITTSIIILINLTLLQSQVGVLYSTCLVEHILERKYYTLYSTQKRIVSDWFWLTLTNLGQVLGMAKKNVNSKANAAILNVKKIFM